MIPVDIYKGCDVAVYGLGRSGLSAAKSLAAGGARIHAWDDTDAARDAARAAGFTIMDLGKFDWRNVAALVLSPGIGYKVPEPPRVVRMAQAMDVPIIGDVELFARAFRVARPHHSRIVGITGTNGKSTTTALIGHILKQAGLDARVGGNIGTGVLDMEPFTAEAIYVLELSSYQLDLCHSLHCDVAVLLNISPDHLDRHAGMAAYVKAKERIFCNQTECDTAIIGVDDGYACALAFGQRPGQAKCVHISGDFVLAHGVSAANGLLYDSCVRPITRIGDLTEVRSLSGRHNHQNAAAAYAACAALGVAPDVIETGLCSFSGLPHRMETVADIDGVLFVNDSKATNACAALQAIRTWPRVHWIAGGIAKPGGITAIEPALAHIAGAYLIGKSAPDFAKTLTDKVPVMDCGTLEAATHAAFKAARQSGDTNAVVLLSPACASFDQFRDFENRGAVFKQIVGKLANRIQSSKAETGVQ